jgi:CHAT domain-containing protein
MLTEAAKSRLTVRGARSLRFAGLGTTRELPGFDALPAVKGELEGILKVGALEGEVHLDEQFTAERVRETLGRKVGLLHLASHFVFQPGTETDSFLLLGDGSRLSLRDLREAGFNFRGVELLTLSACETALGGGADANGREVEGLGALAQQRGARAVMATLWPVADASTGLLMREFYRLRAGEGEVSKAEALRQAQLALLNKRITHESGVPFSHPFFWAPFILMGNWL